MGGIRDQWHARGGLGRGARLGGGAPRGPAARAFVPPGPAGGGARAAADVCEHLCPWDG